MPITVEHMVARGLNVDDMVELTLCRGVQYDNGYTPAPTVDPRGFERGDDTVDEDGPNIIGYVQKIEPEKDRFYLRQTRGEFVEPNGHGSEFPVDSYYVNGEIIRAYRFLTHSTPTLRS